MFLQIPIRDALLATVLASIVVCKCTEFCSYKQFLFHHSIWLSQQSTISISTRFLDFQDLDYGLFPAYLMRTPFSKVTLPSVPRSFTIGTETPSA